MAFHPLGFFERLIVVVSDEMQLLIPRRNRLEPNSEPHCLISLSSIADISSHFSLVSPLKTKMITTTIYPILLMKIYFWDSSQKTVGLKVILEWFCE